jgi:hypothetical protein
MDADMAISLEALFVALMAHMGDSRHYEGTNQNSIDLLCARLIIRESA